METNEIIIALRKFAAEREWEQFHNPKNLSMALSVEVAELMEHLQWLTAEQCDQLKDEKHDPEKREAIAEEIVDVLLYTLRISDVMNIDLSKAVKKKMQKNAEKYPVDKAKGLAKKYNEL